MARFGRWVVACGAVAPLLATAVAAADPAPAVDPSSSATVSPAAGDDHDLIRHRRRHWGLAVAETAGALLIGTGWYWDNTDLNRADWELHWDAPSWIGKLTLEYVRFDTNGFDINAIRHPFGGTVLYQIARANGFEPWGATLAALLGSTVWEYVIEFKEQVSLNDQIVTTWSGIAVGEPLFQLGRFGLGGGAGVAAHALAYAVSPFDAANADAGAGAWYTGSRYWHRFTLTAGGGGEQLDDGARRSRARLAADLELVHDHGYGRAGQGRGRMPVGAWSRLLVDVRLEPGAADSVARTQVRTETWLAGWYARRLVDAPGGVRGWGLLAGLGGGFVYDVRRLAREHDRLNLMELVGPRVELGLYRGGTRATVAVGAYPDFAAVQAHVFGPVPPRYADGEYSVLASQDYYFAAGLTGTARAVLEAPRWSATVEAQAHTFWSIDELDRHDAPAGTEVPRDVDDQVVEVDAWVGARPAAGPVEIGVSADAILRRGAWRDQVRRTTSYSLAVELRARL